MSGPQCLWTIDGDAIWETDCGRSFVLITGTPLDNKMRYCPYCGCPLVTNERVDPGPPPKHPTRGFAGMTPEKRKAIAKMGAAAAHARGTAHRWTSDEARRAGQRGGSISRGGKGRIQ